MLMEKHLQAHEVTAPTSSSRRRTLIAARLKESDGKRLTTHPGTWQTHCDIRPGE